jgi:tripartite-type tricarboxylate transporter receptor subunit TctC
MKKSLFGNLLVAWMSIAGIAWGQSYPNRIIRLVVPTTTGGGTDIVARLYAPKLGEMLGQQVVVDNRAGANALIGADFVAKSAADGYTLLFGTGQNTVNPSLVRKMPHDIVRDFAPVSLVLQSPYFLVVHPSIPAKSVKELIALARANPGKLTFGSAGVGSATHLSGELLKTMARLNMVHVPYKGGNLGLIDLLGGHIDLMFPAIVSILPYYQAGRVRGLGVTSPRRHPSIPEIPAIAETIPGYECRSWYGVLAPAGTPRDIVARLNAALVKLTSTPEIRNALIAQGTDPETNTPEEFARFIRDEVARSARVVKDAGVTPE